MKLDTAIALAAIVLALVWPTHQQLTIRALRYSIRQLHKQLRSHQRALIQLQTAVAGLPTEGHAPMPTVTRPPSVPEIQHLQEASRLPIDPDPTLRLRRPPSILPPPEPATDIERVLTAATRPLTRNEIARELERPGWDLIPDLAALIKAGKIAPTAGHSLELAYRLVPTAGDTLRMARMPVLPGVTHG